MVLYSIIHMLKDQIEHIHQGVQYFHREFSFDNSIKIIFSSAYKTLVYNKYDTKEKCTRAKTFQILAKLFTNLIMHI